MNDEPERRPFEAGDVVIVDDPAHQAYDREVTVLGVSHAHDPRTRRIRDAVLVLSVRCEGYTFTIQADRVKRPGRRRWR